MQKTGSLEVFLKVGLSLWVWMADQVTQVTNLHSCLSVLVPCAL